MTRNRYHTVAANPTKNSTHLGQALGLSPLIFPVLGQRLNKFDIIINTLRWKRKTTKHRVRKQIFYTRKPRFSFFYTQSVDNILPFSLIVKDLFFQGTYSTHPCWELVRLSLFWRYRPAGEKYRGAIFLCLGRKVCNEYGTIDSVCPKTRQTVISNPSGILGTGSVRDLLTNVWSFHRFLLSVEMTIRAVFGQTLDTLLRRRQLF
jgi:hypothetical protein